MKRCAILLSLASVLGAADRPHILWYKQPAAQWTEALPIGNGRLAAMVFGKTDDERIQLNEDTVWAGSRKNRDNPAAPAAVLEVRRLLLEGHIAEAEARAKDMLGVPARMLPYQPLGDLHLRFGARAGVSDYRREQDLDTGVVRATYKMGGVTYAEEVFASAPDSRYDWCVLSRRLRRAAFPLRRDGPRRQFENHCRRVEHRYGRPSAAAGQQSRRRQQRREIPRRVTRPGATWQCECLE